MGIPDVKNLRFNKQLRARARMNQMAARRKLMEAEKKGKKFARGL